MSLTLKQIRNFILSLTFLLLAGGIGYWAGKNDLRFKIFNLSIGENKVSLFKPQIVNREVPANRSNLDFSLFWEVWERLEQTYLEKDKIDPQKMFYGAIAGMTASLDDPYTVFLPPSDNKASKEDLNGSFEGVGIQLGYKDGNNLAVIAPLSGMPAEKAGVKAGDLIFHLKDERQNLDKDTTGMTLPEAVKLIRGPRGTTITLTLLHEGAKESYKVDLKRETIVVPSVEVKFGYLDEGRWRETEEGKEDKMIAWLKLSRFGDLTDQQWDKAIEEISVKCQVSSVKCKSCGSDTNNCAGVILDLRNNPGGYLNGAVNLAGEFLEQGEVVVKQENSNASVQTYKTERIGRLTAIPLVVLVNKGSASASEILAGALRDYDRAKIVGEKTFGKGTIQEAIDLRDGAGLHVTTAKWLLPKGEWIHKEGIKPDVEVALDEKDQTRDKQLEKAAEELLKN